jgi:hypothetical protein
MSRLARTLVLAATLAAMTLAGLTAAAQAQPTAAATPPTGTHDQTNQRASQAHPVSDDAARRQALTQERYYTSFDRQEPATQAALAQERYYSTWRASDPTAAAPAPPSEQPAWLVPAIGVLATALALVGIRATMITRRRRGRVRVRQPA